MARRKPPFPPLDEGRIIAITGAYEEDDAHGPTPADSAEIRSLAWEVLASRNKDDREIVDLQVRAMRSTAENVRASLSTFAAAVAQSPELRARIAADPAGELTDAFELIVRRIYALIDSAEKSAKQVDGPETETKEPS
jgi:hypothetical protein